MGSQYGKIVDWLISAECMNPVILLDEIDKLSKYQNKSDIEGLLTNITDPTQNHKFTDAYFQGVEIPLSSVQWIFSANHIEKINPILLDRFIIINFESFNLSEKVIICNEYLKNKICSNIGLDIEKYKISDNVISYLIKSYTENKNSGVREIKKLLEQLFLKINLLELSNDFKPNISKLKTENGKKILTIDICEKILNKEKKKKESYLSFYA